MGVAWTKEQQRVIDVRDKNVLVSAAAGSGKTAVLVEHIINKITDREKPVDIDRLLVVTFTNAAAAEMRERIRDAVEKALENDPDNAHLSRQVTLLHNAQITTIDSFCLYIIRNYFQKIDLEPAFQVGDEGEFALMKADIMDKVMEEFYGEKDPLFLQFVTSYGTAKSDEPVRQMVSELFRYSRSYPWPAKWLKNCTESYGISDMKNLMEKDWMKELFSCLKREMGDLSELLNQAADICVESDGPYMYEELMKKEAEDLDFVKESMDYLQMSDRLAELFTSRLPVNRKYEGSPEKKEQVKNIRDGVKAEVKKIREKFFFTDMESMLADLSETGEMANVLIRITERFSELFSEMKRERNLVDFSDMEHFALQILVNEETGEPTDVAEELREHFKEIMIDEYQDSNYVQEAILTAIAKREPENPDMFMVGDVKQSIYRFRLARPELFMGKYEAYAKPGESNERIDLHKNFRSREEVLDTVNEVFYKIMAGDLGKIDYDEDAALYPGASYVSEDAEMFQSQVLIAEKSEELLEQTDSDDGQELEAYLVSVKIKELMRKQLVTDKETGELRPVQYKDMVILLRSLSGWSDTFVKKLSEEGIPAFTASQTGYFSTVEIQVLLNLLSIIDNPCQDVALTSVLHSAIGGFSEEDLTWVRLVDRECPFYECVFSYGEKGTDENLRKRISAFLNQLEDFREMVEYTPIHELMIHILAETGYLDYVTALPAGKQKRANVEMLIEKAVAFESTSYQGLFQFIRYIEKLQKYDVDFGEADILNENENAVRIMSIHKSKGLEFPVVFLSGMGKQFNMQDTRGKMVLHPEYGIGLDWIDESRNAKYPTLIKRGMARLIDDENLGEELRVLYVAMTRAKEKLIMTGTLKDAGEKLKEYQEQQVEGVLSFLVRSGAKNYFDWVIPALQSGKQSEQEKITIIDAETLKKNDIEQLITETVDYKKFRHLAGAPNRMDALIEKQLSYEYPFEYEKDIKTKISVSELKHAAMKFEDNEQDTIQWFEPEKHDTVIPFFASGEKAENRGALRGSAVHRVMECFDFKSVERIRELTEEARSRFISDCIDRMLKEHLITEEMKELVNVSMIERFLLSSLALRMCEADKKGMLYKEKPFVLGLKAGDVYGNDSEEMVLIQGIIDVFLYEEDTFTVMDYKTDSVEKPEQLVNRYRRQLELYGEALEKVTGMQMKEMVIYSFHLNKEIRV